MSSAGANSTSVTVSSLSRPSSSSVTSCSSRANSLARGSPLSKSLKLEDPPKSLPRRSVPNVLEDVSMKSKVTDLVSQQNNVGSSSSTIVVVDKDALQLKWENIMGSKYTIVVSFHIPPKKSRENAALCFRTVTWL